jgi:phosphopantetheinyl transferase
MVGNDVVDLTDDETHANVCHPHFDLRVFTDRERDALGCVGDLRLGRWRLWAAKESAYKLMAGLEPSTRFIPRHFEAHLGGRHRGVVRYEGRELQIRFEEVPGGVHAVCARDPETLKAIRTEVTRCDPDADPRTAVRCLARRCIADGLSVPANRITISGGGRNPPLVTVAAHQMATSLSMSHHGRLVACAWLATSTANSSL